MSALLRPIKRATEIRPGKDCVGCGLRDESCASGSDSLVIGDGDGGGFSGGLRTKGSRRSRRIVSMLHICATRTSFRRSRKGESESGELSIVHFAVRLCHFLHVTHSAATIRETKLRSRTLF